MNLQGIPISGETPRPSDRLRGYLLLFSGMALVGCYVALSKPLTAAVPIFVLAWLRFIIGALVMIPWLRPTTRDQALDARRWTILFIQALIGTFLFTVCMLYGVSLTSATAAGLILSTMPAVVALLSWLFLRDYLPVRGWLAVGLAIAGLAILSMAKPAGGGQISILGNLLVLASVFCESTYVILGKKLSGQVSPTRMSALINLFALALMTPLGLWQWLNSDFSLASLNLTLWLLLIFYALAASVFSTWLWLSGLRSVPASRSGVFTLAMPLAATAVGTLYLGEQIGLAHVLAFVCAAAGIWLVVSMDRPPGKNH